MKKRIYNQTALFGPLYAYLVVISPPEKVKADIAKIKKELYQISDISERNLHSIAHVTLTDKLTDDADFATTISGLITAVDSFKIMVFIPKSGHEMKELWSTKILNAKTQY